MESPRGFNDATLGAFADVDPPRRPDRAAGQGARLHAEVRRARRRSMPRCRWIVDRSRGGAGRSRDPRRKAGALAFGCIADTRPRRRDADPRAPRARARASAAGSPRRARCSTTGRRRGRRWPRRRRASCIPIEVFRALRPYRRARSRHRADLRRRRVRAVGAERAAGRAARHDQRRRPARSASSLPMACAARVVEPSAPVFVGAGRRHIRLPHGRVRDRGAAQPALRRGRRHRRALERREQAAGAATTARTARSAASCCRPATTSWWRRWAGTANWCERADELPGAIERSLASGKPACINVMIESIPAPLVRAG